MEIQRQRSDNRTRLMYLTCPYAQFLFSANKLIEDESHRWSEGEGRRNVNDRAKDSPPKALIYVCTL